MKRKLMIALGVGSALLLGTVLAADQYHVYKLDNGQCVVDTRPHEAMKSQRGTDECLGHFDYRTDAMKLRAQKVKDGACKCPSGDNCN